MTTSRAAASNFSFPDDAPTVISWIVPLLSTIGVTSAWLRNRTEAERTCVSMPGIFDAAPA